MRLAGLKKCGLQIGIHLGIAAAESEANLTCGYAAANANQRAAFKREAKSLELGYVVLKVIHGN